MTDTGKKWLIRFNVFVGVIVVVQAIRFDERLLRPVASAIYNFSSWVGEATKVKDQVHEEINKIKKEKGK